MPVIEIQVNGESICRVSGDDYSQMGVYVGNYHDNPDLKIGVNGYKVLDPRTTEHVEWKDRQIDVGDTVSVVIHESGEGTLPDKTSKMDTSKTRKQLQKSLEKTIADALVERRLDGQDPAVVEHDDKLREHLFCSFCARHSSEVEKLIAGPSVNICNECVVTCQQLLRDEAKKS